MFFVVCVGLLLCCVCDLLLEVCLCRFVNTEFEGVIYFMNVKFFFKFWEIDLTDIGVEVFVLIWVSDLCNVVFIDCVVCYECCVWVCLLWLSLCCCMFDVCLEMCLCLILEDLYWIDEILSWEECWLLVCVCMYCCVYFWF